MSQGLRPHTSAPREAPPPGRFRDLECVQLRADLPAQGLKTGEVGTIVHVFDVADAYLVEFVNNDGSTRVLAELTPEKLAPA
jgi:hypothetical protein